MRFAPAETPPFLPAGPSLIDRRRVLSIPLLFPQCDHPPAPALAKTLNDERQLFSQDNTQPPGEGAVLPDLHSPVDKDVGL